MKMSTTYGSEQGLIYVEDEPDAIRRKLRRAQTDSGSDILRGPGKEGISNLIEILAAVRGLEPEAVEREFKAEGYGVFKEAVAEAVVEYLAPVRERYLELRPDEGALEATLREGGERARAIAAGTLAEVREVMGVGPPVGARV